MSSSVAAADKAIDIPDELYDPSTKAQYRRARYFGKVSRNDGLLVLFGHLAIDRKKRLSKYLLQVDRKNSDGLGQKRSLNLRKFKCQLARGINKNLLLNHSPKRTLNIFIEESKKPS